MPPVRNWTKEAFRETYRVERSTGCWVWKRSLDISGYGQLGVGGRHTKAHRFSWEMYIGPIPEDRIIDHKCRNRKCVNPDHMRLCIRMENLRYRSKLKKSTSSSKYKGVHWVSGKWVAKITVNYRDIRLGSFSNEKDAALAYNSAAIRHFGEYALLNNLSDYEISGTETAQ